MAHKFKRMCYVWFSITGKYMQLVKILFELHRKIKRVFFTLDRGQYTFILIRVEIFFSRCSWPYCDLGVKWTTWPWPLASHSLTSPLTASTQSWRLGMWKQSGWQKVVSTYRLCIGFTLEWQLCINIILLCDINELKITRFYWHKKHSLCLIFKVKDGIIKTFPVCVTKY